MVYIRVPAFHGDADANILTVLGWMEAEGPPDGRVMNVRRNPGGNSDRSIAIFTTGIFGEISPLGADATPIIYRIGAPFAGTRPPRWRC